MDPAIKEFVNSWGAMGSIWGIGTSVARVHALLLASDRSLCLNEICESLDIARSNASTSLKELRSYGVVRKITIPGERKEYFESEGDPWAMLFDIARERKRREFDPALALIQRALADLDRAPTGVAVDRLKQLESMFAVLSNLADKALQSDETARALLGFVSGT